MDPFSGFAKAAALHGPNVALECQGTSWTYEALHALTLRWCVQIQRTLPGPASGQRVGVLASRSVTAYAGTLGVLASGATWVALNPSYPMQRNLSILQQAGITLLVVGNEALAQAQDLAQACAEGGRLLTLLKEDDGCIAKPKAEDARGLDAPLPCPPAAQDLAYIVFTSGSTGQPKGVAIEHGNLAVYMDNFRALEPMHPQDRVATTYELTFDVALHDMLCAWWAGAALVVMPQKAMLAPARFILDARITVWFSVASFAMILQKQGLLRAGLFPLLRLSLLCGEALPVSTALAWANAAPNSRLYNVYGPTETTMELAFYLWQDGTSPEQCLRGLVPIGVPFANHTHLLLDEAGHTVVGPGAGELYLQGPQVGPGYWGDALRTAQAFVTLPQQAGRWYKTGDRVERDAAGVYHFMSRIDHMVKVRGHRIELGEVEQALREASGTDLVAVVPKPAHDGMAQGLVAFVGTPGAYTGVGLREALARRLPKPMLPDEVRVIDGLPLNANRKIDRSALAALAATAPVAASTHHVALPSNDTATLVHG